MSDTKDRCENCKYFDKQHGRCHCYPPQLFIEDYPEQGYPKVAMNDYCGEFKSMKRNR